MIVSSQYAQPVSKKASKSTTAGAAQVEETKKLSNHAQRTLDARKKGNCWRLFKYGIFSIILSSDAKIDAMLETQFAAGRLYAAISSRPGQVGRSDGYILEGRELEVSSSSVRAVD